MMLSVMMLSKKILDLLDFLSSGFQIPIFNRFENPEKQSHQPRAAPRGAGSSLRRPRFTRKDGAFPEFVQVGEGKECVMSFST